MEQIVFQIYAYQSGETGEIWCDRKGYHECSRMLLLAYSIDGDRGRIKDLTHTKRLDGELRDAFTSAEVEKVAFDPVVDGGILKEWDAELCNPTSGAWYGIVSFLHYMHWPDRLEDVAGFLGWTLPAFSYGEACVERFCWPNAILGRRRPGDDPGYWEKLKKYAWWRINCMRKLVHRFGNSFRGYQKYQFSTQDFPGKQWKLSERHLNQEIERSGGLIRQAAVRYAEMAESEEEADKRELLRLAYGLRETLRMDFGRINKFKNDGCFSFPNDCQDYDYPQMLFQVLEISRQTELILLNYSKFLYERILHWLTGRGAGDGQRLEVWGGEFQGCLWYAMHVSESVSCGRLDIIIKYNRVVIKIPSGREISFMHPKFKKCGAAWRLSCEWRQNDAVTVREYTLADMMEYIAQTVLCDYVTEMAEIFQRLGILLFRRGNSMILQLGKGENVHMNAEESIREKWWQGLVLMPSISWRGEDSE